MSPPSVTNRLPALSKARPTGPLNPEAKVVRTAPGVNFRMLPVPDSATNRLPALSKARPFGLLNPEAKMLCTPPGVISKMTPACAENPGSLPDTNRFWAGALEQIRMIAPKHITRLNR